MNRYLHSHRLLIFGALALILLYMKLSDNSSKNMQETPSAPPLSAGPARSLGPFFHAITPSDGPKNLRTTSLPGLPEVPLGQN